MVRSRSTGKNSAQVLESVSSAAAEAARHPRAEAQGLVNETQDTHWFSAKVRLVCLIEPTGAMRYMDSIYVFRSVDFQTAFKRALELGKSQERSYLNADQKKVMWKLAEIISLDMIASESLDGVEVYSEPVDLSPGETFSVDVELHPERSEPTQTI